MFVTLLTFYLASMGGVQGWTIETIKDEMDVIEADIRLMPERFQMDFQDLQSRIVAYDKNPNAEKLDDIRLTFAQLQYGFELIRTMDLEDRKARQRYFDTWHKASQLKKRVDQLYVTEGVGGNQALMIESNNSNIRKKPIYEAYTAIFKNYGRKLKRIPECDYQQKMEVVSRLIPVLQNAEKLLDVKNTRPFEKELKKITDVEVLEEHLVNYSF